MLRCSSHFTHLLLPAIAHKTQYHDDGEKELDDLVSTWSLGAPGEMFFRIKKSYAHPVLSEATYNPKSEVVMGSDYWNERATLNNIYITGTSADFQQAKTKLFAQINKDQETKAGAEARKKRVSEEEGDDSEPAEDDVGKEDTKKGRRKGGLAPWCLRLYLRHGDFVVMHGAKIHAAYEVSHSCYGHSHPSERGPWRTILILFSTRSSQVASSVMP